MFEMALLQWIMASPLFLRMRGKAPFDDEEDDDKWPIVILSMDEDEDVEKENLDDHSGSLSFEDCVEGIDKEEVNEEAKESAPLEEVPPLTESKGTHDEEEEKEDERPLPVAGPPHIPKQKKVRLVRTNIIPLSTQTDEPSELTRINNIIPLSTQTDEPSGLTRINNIIPLSTQTVESSGLTRITFIGHSYVKELAKRKFELMLNNMNVIPEYIGVPGGTFKTFLYHPQYLQALKDSQPDIVVVILGGNDLKSLAGLEKNFEECAQFYGILHETVPCDILIASQVETRFYRRNNRFGCPTHHRFDQLRRHFNRFLERHISYDLILEIEGYLDERMDYRDGVHLSDTGWVKYLDIIKKTLKMAEDKRQAHKNNGARKEAANYYDRTTPSATK